MMTRIKINSKISSEGGSLPTGRQAPLEEKCKMTI